MTGAPATAMLPWNRAQAARLAAQRDRLPHALLLAGAPGLGKNVFGVRFAQWLLCAQPAGDAEPCEDCHNCRLFRAGTHPDLALIGPEEAGKAILVDQIRGLNDFLHLTPHVAARKVALISPAEAMNLNAANALLKMLEEPPAGSYLILIGTQLSRLPATIRSRCTRVNFHPPEREVALAWLRSQTENTDSAELLLTIANGSPLRAAELARTDYLGQRRAWLADMEALGARKTDPLACAARWKTLEAARGLAWLEGWVNDLIRVKMAPDAGSLANPDLRERLQAAQKQLNLNQLFSFLEIVTESKNLLGGPLDELLLLEDALIRWTRLTRP